MPTIHTTVSDLIQSRSDRVINSLETNISEKLQADGGRISHLGGSVLVDAVSAVVEGTVATLATQLMEIVTSDLPRLSTWDRKLSSFAIGIIGRAFESLLHKGTRAIDKAAFEQRVQGSQQRTNRLRKLVQSHRTELWARVGLIPQRLGNGRGTMASLRPGNFLLFISYSCKDEDHPVLRQFTERFTQLTEHVGASIFMAENRPEWGKDFIVKVKTALSKADIVVVFLTGFSELSAWVQQEVGFATALEIPVIPVFEPAIGGAKGMIQTADGCRTDQPGKIKDLVEKLAKLATEKAQRPKDTLAPKVLTANPTKVRWVSQGHLGYPLYVCVEISHRGEAPDAVRRVTAKIDDVTYEAENKVTYPKFQQVDFVEHVFEFKPKDWQNKSYEVPISIETVGGKSAHCTINAAPSSYTGTWPGY